MMGLSARTLTHRTGLTAFTLMMSVSGACDSAPAEILDELNAAREGCTEEMLKAGDEECIRMFETYAEMGVDAMETYIGAMRAFDEAIQRRGGFEFDTAGLGRVFTERGSTGSNEFPAGPMSGDAPSLMYEPGPVQPDEGISRPESRDASPVAGGRWTDIVDGAAMPEDSWSADARRAAPAAAGRGNSPDNRVPVPRRGALLPPDQRLNRPWIGDEEAAEPYLGDDRPIGDDPRRRPEPVGGGREGEPYMESPGVRW